MQSGFPNSGFPFARNFALLDQLRWRLEKTLLKLEKSIHEKDELFQTLETEVQSLQDSFFSYEHIYLTSYLHKFKASLHKIKQQYQYQPQGFNVLYYLMEKISRLSEEEAAIIERQSSPPIPQSGRLPIRIQGSAPTAYIQAEIESIPVLIPYMHHFLIATRSAHNIQPGRPQLITFRGQSYKIFALWSPNGLQSPPKNTILLLRWYRYRLGLTIDRKIGHIQDPDDFVLRNVQSVQKKVLDEILGEIRIFGRRFYILDLARVVKRNYSGTGKS